jgi:hypothetical protein
MLNAAYLSFWMVPAMRAIIGTLLLLASWQAALATGEHSSSSFVYSDPSLRLRYEPPGGMQDETESGRAQIQDRAAARHTSKVFDLLLAMTAGPDDTAPDWYSLIIETYPRSAVSEPDDAKAEAQMNAWVAHSKDASALPKSVVLSGQSFSVSVFGLQEGTVKKGAVVWTTVRKGKLLSFAFVANSPEQLKRLTESMKSIQFF